MKLKIDWKITVVLAVAGSCLITGYVLQKPFVPSPYSDYKSRWSTQDLNKLQQSIEQQEKTFPNLKRDNEKKVGLNAGAQPTEYAFVYMPGFSATRKEIFPVVEALAKRFSANYFLTRFPAHGESALEFKDLKAQELFDTAYEAVEIAPKLGKKKIFIGTSTGAAMTSAALVQDLDIDAAIFIAPA